MSWQYNLIGVVLFLGFGLIHLTMPIILQSFWKFSSHLFTHCCPILAIDSLLTCTFLWVLTLYNSPVLCLRIYYLPLLPLQHNFTVIQFIKLNFNFSFCFHYYTVKGGNCMCFPIQFLFTFVHFCVPALKTHSEIRLNLPFIALYLLNFRQFLLYLKTYYFKFISHLHEFHVFHLL